MVYTPVMTLTLPLSVRLIFRVPRKPSSGMGPPQCRALLYRLQEEGTQFHRPMLSTGVVPVENLAPSHEYHAGKLADVVKDHVVILDTVRYASDIRMC